VPDAPRQPPRRARRVRQAEGAAAHPARRRAAARDRGGRAPPAGRQGRPRLAGRPFRKNRTTRCSTADCRIHSSRRQAPGAKVIAMKRSSPTHEAPHMKTEKYPRVARSGLVPVALAMVMLLAPAAHAGPYIWDDDNDAIDDRIESVQLLGFRFSFENADSLLRQRFEVTRVLGSL